MSLNSLLSDHFAVHVNAPHNGMKATKKQRRQKDLMENKNWYAIMTEQGQEYNSAELIKRVVPCSLCTLCSIPKKAKPFRHGGVYYATEDILFPGYVFAQTAHAEELRRELQKSREFPQFPVFGKDKEGNDQLIPISEKDLAFLQEVCGGQLQSVMGITDITLGEDKRILRARGVLEHYVGQVVKLNLHKRIAVTRVELFNRSQDIFFGIRLKQDVYQAG